MRLATWNVNSVNARLETVLRWFELAQPDVACLQEIKCVDEKFPAEAFERLGYNVAVHGQKTYNGVALVSKSPLELSWLERDAIAVHQVTTWGAFCRSRSPAVGSMSAWLS